MASETMRARRREFQILVVDRNDDRRKLVFDLLIGLGFESVQLAAAPGSAASFADANPPHLVVLASDPESEARETIAKLRSISRETQFVLLSAADDIAQTRTAQKTAMELGVWDQFVLPLNNPGKWTNDDIRRTVELVMDRACQRLLFQFESEHWKQKALEGAGASSATAVRDRMLANMQEFAKIRDLDSILATTCTALSRAIDGKPVIYFRWVAIRSSFALSHMTGAVDARAKGLGFPVKDTKALRDLGQLQDLRSFMLDVFKQSEFSVLLHGSPEDPTGLFVLFEPVIESPFREEFEAVSFLFDLTWARLEALRDKHALERIDRGTGLPNRKALKENLDYECVRARRLRHPLSAASVELTGEKSGEVGYGSLEERLGAPFESVMKIVGATLRRALRGTDYVARFDRSRFTILMPHTSVAEAVGVVDRMCRLVERLQLPAIEAAIPGGQLRCRAGVAEYPRLAADADGLLQAMDDALTAARTGFGDKNIRVMVFEIPPGFEPDFTPVLAGLTVDPGFPRGDA